MNLFAYELLFRGNNSEDNRALVVGGDSASAQVMLSAFGDIGLPEVWTTTALSSTLPKAC